MKKFVKSIVTLSLVLVAALAVVSCGKNDNPVDPDDNTVYHTITYMEGTTVLATEKVEDGKTGKYEIDGYFILSDLYTSYEDLAKLGEAGKWDTKTAITEDVILYARFLKNKLADGDTHTYYSSFSLSPSTFNPLTYKSTSDAVPLDYTTNGLYEFAYNADGTGFELVPVMAAADPEDVTATYAALEGDPFNLKGAQTGYVFRIQLNHDAKWENGDAITADDYIYTMRTLLDGRYNNYRASNYYQGSSAIYGAKDYFMSGKSDTGSAYLAYEEYNEEDDEDLIFVWDYSKKDEQKGGTAFNTWFWKLLTNSGFPTFPYAGYNTISDILSVLGLSLAAEDTVYQSMNGKTLAEIKADTTMNAAFEELADKWCDTPDDILDFCIAEYTMPTYDFDHVGIKKIDTYTIDIAYTSELVGFYQKYTIGLPLVKESLYEASLKQDSVTGAWSSDYGTAVDKYMGYGPYKFTRYIQDQVMEFERNENWFGYDAKYADTYGTFIREIDGAEATQYETTNIVLNYVPNISTREQMFLSGLLDGFGLNKAYFDTYGSSSRKYSATGAATFYGIVLSDYDSLVEREAVLNKTTYDENYNGATQQYNKTILSIKEFRQALCYALDRRSLITNLYPGGSPAISLFSDLIIADPENGTAFNSFDSTKAAICEFWGVTYGEDGEFDTLDEAYAAITGYDMTSAKRLVDVAVAKAKEAGLMGDNTIVKIDYCCSSDSETEQLWYNTLKDCFLEMVKGTALEGKFEFNYDYSLGSDFSKGIQNGLADTAWGFGWQGGELDPYSLVEVYVDGASGAEEPYQYDMWIDRSSIEYNITLSFDIDGDDTAEEYTYSVYDWYRILNGQAEDDEDLPNWRFGKVADSVRAEVLAALEKAILGDYTSIPMMNQGSIQLLSYKINFGKETYMFGMGFGGIRYITYNYTDGQWAEWVASQGGSLNYK